MEFLAKQFRQIGMHLGGLTGSQRLALLLCVVLLVLGSVWLLQWSGQAEYVPLLDQPMSAEELAGIENQLRSSGQTFRTSGGQILVRGDDRTRLQGVVAQAGLLPSDTSIGFNKLISESNLWIPREESRWQRKIALGNELSKVLTHFDGVAEARVFLDQAERRTFGEPASGTTASVFLKTRSGAELNKSQVSAIASLVAGAIHGLKPETVRIVDATTGRPYRVPSDEDAMPFDAHDLRQRKEDYFGRKILAQLAYIPGVLVGVNVDIDMEQRRQHIEKFGPPVVSEEESSTSETQGMTQPVSPGVKANTRASISSPGSSESSTTEETRTSMLGERDKTITDSANTRGDVRSITASVNVPRSYFVAVFKQLQAGKEPGEKDLDPIIAVEEKKIRSQVKPLIAASSDAQVDVSWFYDQAAAPATLPAEATSQVGVAAVARGYAREIALGVLAIISLFMVLQMARRASPAPVSAGAATAGAGTSGADGAAAMSAEEREAMDARNAEVASLAVKNLLPQLELDEAALRLKQIMDEIGKMVQEQPEIPATIIERWIDTPH